VDLQRPAEVLTAGLHTKGLTASSSRVLLLIFLSFPGEGMGLHIRESGRAFTVALGIYSSV